VAKAFRIGANLVLAKPINVEQSKGTLRVARGLLRKADAAAKPAAATSSAAALSAPAARAAASASLSLSPATSEPPSFDAPSPALTSPALSGSALPSAAVTSSDASNLNPDRPNLDRPNFDRSNFDRSNSDRSNSDPVKFDAPSPNSPLPAHGLSASGTEWPVASVAQAPKAHKHYPWESLANPAEPVAPALPHAPVAPGRLNAALGGEPQASQPGAATPAGNAEGTGSSAGTGAATLRAKQTGLPAARTPASEATATKPSPAGGESPAGKTLSAESPGRGALRAVTEEKKQAPASSRSKVLALVAVLLLAAAAYYAWTEMHPSPAPSGGQKPTAAVTASPIGGGSTATEGASQLPDADSSKPSAMVESSITSETAKPEAELAPPPHDPAIAVAKPRTASRPATLEPPPSQTLNLSSENAAKAIAGIVSSSASSGSPAAPPPAAAGPLLLSEASTEALLIKKVSPVYPDEALVKRIEGSVALEANIDSNGEVTDVKVTSGDEILGRAASDAVKQWKYKPYYLNSQPVAIRTQITLNFKLPN
jgi:protein TonB